MCPITWVSSMFVPIANSPTRSEFSSVCGPKGIFELATQKCFDQPVRLDANRERHVLEAAEPGAQVVADDTVDDKRAVDLAWRREDLTTG